MKDYLNGKNYFLLDSIYLNSVDVFTETSYHAHNFVEIAYVEDGCGYHIADGEKRYIESGNIIIINFDVPHKFISINNLKICNCIFKPCFLDKTLVNSRNFSDIVSKEYLKDFIYIGKIRYKQIVLKGIDITNIESLYKKMIYEYTHKNIGYTDILKGYLIELLVIILRTLNGYDKTDKSQQIVERVTMYIENNFQNSITLTELCALTFLSTSQLIRLFKKYTNMTPNSYIQKIRIEHACKELITTEKKIADISNEIGYSDIKHFQKIFKRNTGMSPSDYRRCGHQCH